MGGEAIDYDAAPAWTEEFLDFEKKADVGRARHLEPNPGWIVLREGEARGPLLGGCLETIAWHLKESEWWLDLEGALLFLETSEEAPRPGTSTAI